MKRRFLFFASILFVVLSLFSCRKESLVDLSQRGGNWTVTSCNEPGSDGVIPIPDENGIFVFVYRIEYNAKNEGVDRLSLFRTVQVNGASMDYDGSFLCTIEGDKLTLQEEVYGGPHALQFTYQIQKLNETEFVLKRIDLGKNEGIVTLRR